MYERGSALSRLRGMDQRKGYPSDPTEDQRLLCATAERVKWLKAIESMPRKVPYQHALVARGWVALGPCEHKWY